VAQLRQGLEAFEDQFDLPAQAIPFQNLAGAEAVFAKGGEDDDMVCKGKGRGLDFAALAPGLAVRRPGSAATTLRCSPAPRCARPPPTHGAAPPPSRSPGRPGCGRPRAPESAPELPRCPQPRCNRRTRSTDSADLSLRRPFSAPVERPNSSQPAGRKDRRTVQSSSIECLRNLIPGNHNITPLQACKSHRLRGTLCGHRGAPLQPDKSLSQKNFLTCRAPMHYLWWEIRAKFLNFNKSGKRGLLWILINHCF